MLKKILGNILIFIAHHFPKSRPFLKLWGMRTKQEWYKNKVFSVELGKGKRFFLKNLDKNYLSLQAFWHGSSFYEPLTVALVCELVNNQTTFVDVGANVGYYSLCCASLCTPKKIISFEPSPQVYKMLEANVSLNNFDFVKTEQLAVSDADAMATLFLTESAMSATLQENFNERVTDKINIPAITLDSYFSDKTELFPLLIKIDVEGFEEGVIRGALKTLTLNKPDLVLEVVRPYSNEVVSLLKQLGYSFYSVNDKGLDRREILTPFVRDSYLFMNYFVSVKPADQINDLSLKIAQKAKSLDLQSTSKYVPRMAEKISALSH